MESLQKRKREETDIGKQESHKKRHMVSADDPTRSGPLSLPSVVVDRILENLDGPNLLTARLVCQSWNAEITSRNHLWKQRCERKHIFTSLSTTPLGGTFHQYVNIHRRLRSGGAFQVDQHSEALDCLHGAREDRSLSWIFGTVPEESDVVPTTNLPRHRQPRPGVNTAIALTRRGELVLTHMKTKRQLWSHADVAVMYCGPSSYDHIYCVTIPGEIKQFSLDGRCVFHINTAGTLRAACCMSVHTNCRFFLVGHRNDDVHLVHHNNGHTVVTKLQLTYPDLPEPELEEESEDIEKSDDEDEEDEEEDDVKIIEPVEPEDEVVEVKIEEPVDEEVVQIEEPVDEEEDEEETVIVIENEKDEGIGFLADTSLSDGQLAVYLQKFSCVVVAIIKKDGTVLHKVSQAFGVCYQASWATPSSPLTESVLVVESLGEIKKYTIRCQSTGIEFKLVWQKFLPEVLNSPDAHVLSCGDQFIVGMQGSSLVICRLDDGRQVSFVPGFFRTTSSRIYDTWAWADLSTDSLEHMVRKVEIDRANQWRNEANYGFYLANTGWLDGLSPATTNPNVPIVLFLPDMDTDIRCVRWSADLWT